MQTTTYHHVKSIRKQVDYMIELGYPLAELLNGTEFSYQDLESNELCVSFSDEFRIISNFLELTDDPTLGLSMAKLFPPEGYGLMGYAMISSEDLRSALRVVTQYGALTFSMFHLRLNESNQEGIFAFTPKMVMPTPILKFYAERDTAAFKVATEGVLQKPFSLKHITFTHGHPDSAKAYEDYFQCSVAFGKPRCQIIFEASLLDLPLPQRDIETSAFCQQKCDLLINKMSSQSPFINQVRQGILARPGYFPSIEEIAARLSVSSRTLRRRLKEEGHNYQSLLDEIRFGLAKEYLTETSLGMDSIAELLDYSDSSNFSHAFKRWAEASPSDFRLRHSGNFA